MTNITVSEAINLCGSIDYDFTFTPKQTGCLYPAITCQYPKARYFLNENKWILQCRCVRIGARSHNHYDIYFYVNSEQVNAWNELRNKMIIKKMEVNN